MSQLAPFDGLTNDDLHARLRRVLERERHSCVELLKLLSEVDRRRSYLAESAPSLFAFCTRLLGMSEAETYLRITASRAAHRFPVILELMAAGKLHLTAVVRLSRHLTEANHRGLLLAASGRSQRDLNRLLAGFAPEPPRRPRIEVVVESAVPSEAPSSTSPTMSFDLEERTNEEGSRTGAAPAGAEDMQAAAARAPEAISTTPASLAAASGATSGDHVTLNTATSSAGGIPGREEVEASAEPAAPAAQASPAHSQRPTRYRLHVTISESAMTTLEILTDLMRHQVPDGDPALILERALEHLLEVVGRRKFGVTKQRRAGLTISSDVSTPRPPSRHIPAAVRRSVRERDGGRCAFRASSGQRCPARAWLEYHHVVPFARGGPATVENIELRCRAHNQHEARRDFGARAGREARAGTALRPDTEPRAR